MGIYMNNTVVDNLTKFRTIMEKYRSGEYGSEHLTLYEILAAAGEPNLLRQMSLEELDELIHHSFGMQKQMLIMIKAERTAKSRGESGFIKMMNPNNNRHR